MNKKIVLLGDSITEAFPVERLLEYNVLNRGISGNNTLDVLERLQRDVIEEQPDIVYLLIGTNDMAQGFSEHTILANIEKIASILLEELPDVELVLTSILPTRNDPPRPNSRIRIVNAGIEGIAETIGLRYFDLHAEMIDKDGKLKADFTEDGLHLTANAYEHWIDVLVKDL